MRYQTKARPLLAAFALAATLSTVTAPAVAAQPVSTFFAYTAPLAAPLGETAPHVPVIAATALIAATLAAVFLPARRTAPAAPAAPAPSGPIFCPTTRRWRDPVSRRFVKAPR
ncbi:hypothetical protein [Methylobacterium fujisawaense]